MVKSIVNLNHLAWLKKNQLILQGENGDYQLFYSKIENDDAEIYRRKVNVSWQKFLILLWFIIRQNELDQLS